MVYMTTVVMKVMTTLQMATTFALQMKKTNLGMLC